MCSLSSPDFDRGDIQQFVDQVEHRPTSLEDCFHEVELFRRQASHRAIAQELGQPANRGQRIAQIVGRHAQKPVLGGIGPAQLFNQELLLLSEQLVLQMRADASLHFLHLEGL